MEPHDRRGKCGEKKERNDEKEEKGCYGNVKKPKLWKKSLFAALPRSLFLFSLSFFLSKKVFFLNTRRKIDDKRIRKFLSVSLLPLIFSPLARHSAEEFYAADATRR